MYDADLTVFEPWPKTPRLKRTICITEKIDGTNGQLSIRAIHGHEIDDAAQNPEDAIVVDGDGDVWALRAGSRKRWLAPGERTDSFGFAAWAHENAAELVRLLGEGRHYGEWFGRGIQRGYGMDDNWFALFNVMRWADDPNFQLDAPDVNMTTVPRLYVGDWSDAAIVNALEALRVLGSQMVPFGNPEGIIVRHLDSKQNYKVLLEHDELPKSLVAARSTR